MDLGLNVHPVSTRRAFLTEAAASEAPPAVLAGFFH